MTALCRIDLKNVLHVLILFKHYWINWPNHLDHTSDQVLCFVCGWENRHSPVYGVLFVQLIHKCSNKFHRWFIHVERRHDHDWLTITIMLLALSVMTKASDSQDAWETTGKRAQLQNYACAKVGTTWLVFHSNHAHPFLSPRSMSEKKKCSE